MPFHTILGLMTNKIKNIKGPRLGKGTEKLWNKNVKIIPVIIGALRKIPEALTKANEEDSRILIKRLC